MLSFTRKIRNEKNLHKGGTKNPFTLPKKMRVELYEDWLDADAESGVFNRVVTGDESWIYKYEVPVNGVENTRGTVHKEGRMFKSKVKAPSLHSSTTVD